MSDPMLGRPGRGPIGTHTNRPKIDPNTNVRNRSGSPADRGKSSLGFTEGPEIRRIKYVGYAYTASGLMQARSTGQSAVAAGESLMEWLREEAGMDAGNDKPTRVQSFLGGAFLRMYLDGKVDPEVVAEAGDEIGESKEFALLRSRLQAHLQSIVTSQRLREMEKDKLRAACDRYLDARNRRTGIAFRHTLNTVIGGVSGVDVEKIELLEEKASESGTDRVYRVGIIFRDTYDFENRRSGQYDRYRKKLAALLRAEKFDEFEAAFHREASPFSEERKTKLDDAAVFASFMYALEKKGWTPGPLKWQVAVPAEVTLRFAKKASVKGK